jgi:excisionase family DNA binding protein
MNNGDDWITTQEAAQLSGYHPEHLRRLIKRGDIVARKVSIIWLISRRSLLEFVAQAEQSGDKRRGPK